MTLNEWETAFGKSTFLWKPEQERSSRWIPCGGLWPDAERALFHLSDYLVSSITGGTIWLVPRPTNKAPDHS